MELTAVEDLPVDNEVDTRVVAALVVVAFPLDTVVDPFVEDVTAVDADDFPELRVVETLYVVVVDALPVVSVFEDLPVL